MKVMTVWGNSGSVSLVRDSEGGLYIPKKSIKLPEDFFLYSPSFDPQQERYSTDGLDVVCFIDISTDSTKQALNKLDKLVKHNSKGSSNLLIVTANDSIERKAKLADKAIEFFQRVRLLEVSLPLTCLSPTLTKEGLTYHDIIARRESNFSQRKLYSIVSSSPIKSTMDSLIGRVLFAYINHREIWFPSKNDGETFITSEYEFATDLFYHSELIPFQLTGKQLLPLAPHPYDDIASQNPRHGIVKKLRHIKNHSSLPSSLITIQSDVADLRFVTHWANNTVCQGSTFGDLRSAELAALGEAYERYCVNIIDPSKIVVGSQKSLLKKGLHPACTSDFILFNKEQYENFQGRFTPFNDSTETSWIGGHTFEGEEIFLPVSMVFVNHKRLKKMGEFPLPHINAPAYAGISAGKTQISACVNALQEIMERHATMCWWHNPPVDKKLHTPANSSLAHLIQQFEDKGNTVSIVGITNRFNLPIYAATIINEESGIVNTGFACRLTNDAAIRKALTEACTLQAGSFDLLNPHGELFKAIERGELWKGIAKPWREDRHYLDYYSKDFATMNDLMLQQQVYLDKRLLPKVRSWLTPQLETDFKYPDVKLNNVEEELQYYLAILKDMSIQPAFVDVTSPDVASLQISVVRVIAPGLIPNFAVGDIHLGKNALQSEPVLLGTQMRPTPTTELNLYPLPHC